MGRIVCRAQSNSGIRRLNVVAGVFFVAGVSAILASCNTDYARLEVRNDAEFDVRVLHCENRSCSKLFDDQVLHIGGVGFVNAAWDVPEDLGFERLSDHVRIGCLTAAPEDHGKAKVGGKLVDQPILVSMATACPP